jgi:5-oxoprolinase (ATP-hydrolysing)
MAGAIRKISVARGFDPKLYALLVFGGAGGLHGCAVAQLLGIQTLILPFDGGLLSAFGIGQARIERIAARQVLQQLSEAALDLANHIEELIGKATDLLRRDVGGLISVEVQNVLLFMRLKGQESTIEIPYQWAVIRTINQEVSVMTEKIETVFREQYQQLYGHFPANRTIEVESIRVIVSEKQSKVPSKPAILTKIPAEPAFFLDRIPVYEWAKSAGRRSIQRPRFVAEYHVVRFSGSRLGSLDWSEPKCDCELCW